MQQKEWKDIVQNSTLLLSSNYQKQTTSALLWSASEPQNIETLKAPSKNRKINMILSHFVFIPSRMTTFFSKINNEPGKKTKKVY